MELKRITSKEASNKQQNITYIDYGFFKSPTMSYKQ